jgi:hypothetical protein
MDYAYLLTPSGIKSKAKLTAHFLECKAVEYAMLKSKLEKHEIDIKHVERSNKIRVAKKALQ